MIHVLHLVPTGGWAGTEQMVANLANRTVGEGHRLTVVLREGPNAPRAAIEQRFDERIALIFVPDGLTVGAVAEYVVECLDADPDVVHTHLRGAATLAETLELPAPTIAHLHVRYFEAHCWRADAVVCVSPWQAGDLPDHVRSYLVPNWVEDLTLASGDECAAFRERVGIDGDGLLVGAIGRLADEKAFDRLCAAFLRAADSSDRLVVIGDGPRRDDLAALAAADMRIRLTGHVPDGRRLLPAFDIFASSSRLESFGMSVLEAMTVGLPIVATAARGVVDLLGDSDVPLVAIDDVDALAAALADELAACRSDRRRVDYDVSAYTPAAGAARMRDAYADLLGALPSACVQAGVDGVR